MKKVLYLLFIATILSCQKNEGFLTDIIPEEKQSEVKTIEEILTSKAVIGKKLTNPYSVEIMQQAYNNIQTKTGLPNNSIEGTHHYIVFKPSCHAHYRSLIMDKDLESNIYPYPLDHEVTDGWVTLDPNPEFSTNGYQHRWGYIPINKDLSHIECPYEILYDIYAPEGESETKSSISESLFEELDKEAHHICGMELIPITTKAEAVTPSGNIVYRDSTVNERKYTGCYGMSVRANRLTKKAYGHCDDNGDFVCDGSFKYNWTYNVYFSRTDFEMRRDYSNEEFYLKFTTYDSDSEYFDCVFYCAILRAACKIYYGNIHGLNRPYMAEDINDRMYIQAVRGCHPTDYNTVGQTGGNEEYPHIQIFRETRAMGMEWYITKDTYPKHKPFYFKYQTDLVQELVEGDGVHATYSMIELENALTSTNVLTWNQWRDNIITYYNNRNDEDYIRQIFEENYYSN